MSFQFSCPQGHVLQSELSQVGQLFQCPYCGESFVIPSPHGPHDVPYSDPHAGGFVQGAPAWPGGQPSFPLQPFPVQPVPVQTFPGQNFPGQGVPLPVTPIAGGAFQPLSPGQAASFQASAFHVAKPIETAAEGPTDSDGESEGGRSGFVLDFDPTAKAALPFDLPGSGGDTHGAESHTEPDAAVVQPFAAPESPESRPTVDFAELGDGPKKVKTLHVRCPSGHALKVSSDQNRKPVRCSVCKQVFEVRYENSLEFQKRTEKVVTRARNKEGQVWLAWALVAAFIGIVGLVLLIIYTSRG